MLHLPVSINKRCFNHILKHLHFLWRLSEEGENKFVMKQHKQRRRGGGWNGNKDEDRERANQEHARKTAGMNSSESSDWIGRGTDYE